MDETIKKLLADAREADESRALLARAILELAEKSAHVWDFDGEQEVSAGVDLSEEAAIRAIANQGRG